MPVAADPDEPEDEGGELAPEERVALRKGGEKLRRLIAKLNLGVAPPGVLDAISKINAMGIRQPSVLDSAAFKAVLGDRYKNAGLLSSEALAIILGAQSGIAERVAKMGDLGSKNPALNALAKAGIAQIIGVSAAVHATNVEAFASVKNLATLDQSIAASMLPALATSRAMGGHLAGVNADVLRATRLPQTEIGLLTNYLAKNADFGLGKGVDNYLRQFAANQSKWIAGIAPLLYGFKFRPYPGNLDAIEGLKISEVQAVVMLDGIALYGVPRTSIAQALVRAEDSAKRRRIVGRQWTKIVADCRAALDSCESPSLASEVRHTVAAIEALEAGHIQAAQALVGSVIDTLVNGYFGKKRHHFTPNRNTKTSDAYQRMHVRQYIALAPVWQAYQRFRPADGDAVPATFSRHATAHTVSGRQYSRINTVQALMIACGILLFREEDDAKERAA